MLPLLKVRSENGHVHQGTSCLFLIVMSECAFLIWKLQCTRLLNTTPESPERTISPQEVRNKTLNILNNHLDQDKSLSSKLRYGREALPKDLILNTWSGVIKNENSLPENWLQANRVLVGIPLRPEAGTNNILSLGVG